MSSWSRLKMDYRNSYRQSIIGHWVANFMFEHYVSKMVREMPIKPCMFKAIVRKAVSNLVYKDCLPRDIPENPVLRALDSWVVGFKKAHEIE